MALDALQVFQTRTVVEFIKNNYLIGWVFLCEEAGNVRRDESGAAGEKN